MGGPGLRATTAAHPPLRAPLHGTSNHDKDTPKGRALVGSSQPLLLGRGPQPLGTGSKGSSRNRSEREEKRG